MFTSYKTFKGVNMSSIQRQENMVNMFYNQNKNLYKKFNYSEAQIKGKIREMYNNKNSAKTNNRFIANKDINNLNLNSFKQFNNNYK